MVFPFIHRTLAHAEPAPAYEQEERGMGELGKVLAFARDDQFYPGFAEKASYMICSIAGSQYFTNGNKRLGIATLVFFLSMNDASVENIDTQGYEKIVQQFFPDATWEHNPAITDPHALFLYNLAITIGDRAKWGCRDFTTLREKVAALFGHIYQL